MSTTAAPPTAPATTGPGAARAGAIVAGALMALVALALALAGGGMLLAHATLRDDDGYYTSGVERVTTSTRALMSERLEIGDLEGPDWALDAIGPVRVRATSADGRPLFVGIAPARDVETYLRDVAHEQVTEVRDNPFRIDSIRRDGSRTPAPPGAQEFWHASAAGPGAQQVTWDVEQGDWELVVMNADGSPGVAADVRVAARAGFIAPLGAILLGLGVVLGLIALAVIVAGLPSAPSAARDDAEAAPGAVPAGAPTHPVTVEARLDEPLSRWLWLVKWLLALPHVIVLSFLWAAFTVLTLAALVAIVVTGRYPRAIFDFNVGVLRWTWRVAYYATAVIGTDRYPPFTLGRADYPADLEIPYPRRLSRWQAPLKPWLLALPHLAILAAFSGAWNATWAVGDATVTPPGMVTVLVLTAGAVLLVTGRYPRDVFALLVGIARWTVRVVAYVALMRDEYPPFRLDR